MQFTYTLTRKRITTLRLRVLPGGIVAVSAPRQMSLRQIERFIASKSAWVREKILEASKMPPRLTKTEAAAEYHKYHRQALSLAKQKVAEYSLRYGFRPGTMSIGKQESRWGSCSRNGRLRFNYKIVFMPPSILEYLIIHELCHLREFSHSRKFWSEVGAILPDYAERRQELRNWHHRRDTVIL